MANIELRSLQSILGTMIARIKAKTDINDVSPGSALLTILEAAASSDYLQEAKLLQLLNSRNIDKATGLDLENLAFESGLTPSRRGASPSSVALTISDRGFTKVASNIYAGTTAPAAGDTTIKIVDGSGFTASGTLYIGRGTQTSESLAYVSTSNSGSYWLINLASPLTKDHLVGEEVVLAKNGNRTVPSGTQVTAAGQSGLAGITFKTQFQAILADGEDQLGGVLAIATVPGSSGNVGRNKITTFQGAPWSTAAVTNIDPAIGGVDAETDAELRQRIKDYVHNLSGGTERAIINAVIGASDSEENKRVVSAYLRKPILATDDTILFIDDGTGFAPSFSGIGEEVIITKAVGTESYVQLQDFPVVKTQIASVLKEPFNLTGGEFLYVEVDGLAEQTALPNAGYRTPGVVTAQEVAEAINKYFTTVEARAKDGQLFITPTASDPDYIRIGAATNGTDANSVLRFPISKQYTIRLYRSDRLLEKKGAEAIVQSLVNSQWTGLTSSETLQLNIDGIDSPVVPFSNAEFLTYTSSSSIPQATVGDWVIMINRKFIGVTAAARDDGTFTITSNRGRTNAAKISVIGGTLSSKLFAANSISLGTAPEFTLNRLSGQVKLASRMNPGEELKAGNVNTRGFALTTAQAAFNLSGVTDWNAGPARASEIVLITDGPYISVPVAQVNSIAFSSPSNGILRITGANGQFATVKVDDWAHLYNLPSSGILRVVAIDATNSAYVDFADPSPGLGTTAIDGITKQIRFFRTSGLPQILKLPIGAAVVSSAVVTAINSQILGAFAEVIDSGAIRIRTTRFLGAGALAIPSIAGNGKNLGILEGDYLSNDPHTASIESGILGGIPSQRLTVQTSNNTPPYDDFQAVGTPFAFENANKAIQIYSGSAARTIRQPLDRVSTSEIKFRTDLPTQNIGLGPDLRAVSLSGMEFGQTDNMVFLVDNDPAKRTFDIPMYVDATVAGPSVPSTTQMDLADSTLALLGSSTRWLGHRFEDYRVWFQANANMPFSTANSQVKLTSVTYGPNGEKVSVGYTYPTQPSAPAAAAFSVDPANDQIKIQVSLEAGNARAIGLQPNRRVDVNVSGNTVKLEFLPPVDLSSVLPGDVVSLTDPAYQALNQGQMKVVSVSNLHDNGHAWEFKQESTTGDVTGATGINLNTAPTYVMRVGDSLKLTGISRTISQAYNNLSSTATAVAANQITVNTGKNFTTTGGSIVVNATTYVYTAYNASTGVFTGVSPDPSGVVTVGNTVFQYKNEVVVPAGSPFTASASTFVANSTTYNYTSYTSSSGTFTGVTPDPSGLASGTTMVQSVSNGATRLITAVSGSNATVAAPGFSPDGTGFVFNLSHKAVTASAAPSFSPAIGDLLQVGNAVVSITGIIDATNFDVDVPYSWTGNITGTLSRLYIQGNRFNPGTTESHSVGSAQSVQVYDLPAPKNTATTLITLINATAGVKDIVLASNATGSTGAGSVLKSTEDELGTGATTVPLQNGESFVFSTGTSSPAIRLKEPIAHAPQVGDKVRLVPSTARNIADHFSRKQISGLTVAADVELVDQGRRVQVSSKTPGGLGQVFAVGGRASGQNVLSIRAAATEINANRAQVELDKSSIELLSPGHTVRIAQSGRAKKSWTFANPSAGTTVQIAIPTPGIGQLTFGVPFVSIYSSTYAGSSVWSVRNIGRSRIRYEVVSGSAFVPSALKANDWVLVGDGSSYAGITTDTVFSPANRGWFQVRETDNATYFDVDSIGVEEFVTATQSSFIFISYHSVRPGDQIVIGFDSPVATANKGTFTILNVPSTTSVTYANANVATQTSTALGATGTASISILDQGYNTYRKVVMVSPKPSDPTNRSLLVLSPGYDMSLLSEGQGAKIYLPNRLNYGTDPVPGVSGYSFWTGLLRTVQRTIDGYEPDSVTYPGVGAAGVNIEPRPPQKQAIRLAIKVKTAKGVSLQALSDTIKSEISGYVNSLGLGQDVVMSEVIKRVQQIPGVDACVLVFPVPGTERVTVGDSSIARITTNDITLS